MDKIFQAIEDLTEQVHLEQAKVERLNGKYPVIFDGLTKEPVKSGVYHKRFDSTQQQGTSFGFLWITAQEKAIEVARFYHLDVEKPEVKALLADVVLQVLKEQQRYEQESHKGTV